MSPRGHSLTSPKTAVKRLVLWFEYRAWIDAMMRKQGDQDLETCLTTVFDDVICDERSSTDIEILTASAQCWY